MPPKKPRSAACGRFHLNTAKKTRIFLTTDEDIDGYSVSFTRPVGAPGYWRGDGVNAVGETGVNTTDLWTVVVRFHSSTPIDPEPEDFETTEGLSMTVINPGDESHPSDPLSIVGVVIP